MNILEWTVGVLGLLACGALFAAGIISIAVLMYEAIRGTDKITP